MSTNASSLRSYVRTVGVNASTVAPAAGTVIADTGALPPGRYDVQASGSYGGVADVIDNMALFLGGQQIMSLPVQPVANSSPIFVPLPGMVINLNERLTIRNIAAGGAGTIFRGTIIATPVITQYPQ